MSEPKETSEPKITANIKGIGSFGDDATDVPVLNPGDWFGKTWLLGIGGSYTPLWLVVEADGECSAIDELADDETYGHQIRIPESDFTDYGYEVNPGDIIGGIDVTEKGWMRLDGVLVTDPEQGRYLQEPYLGGNSGIPCDLDNLMIHGDDRNGYKTTYNVPGWPVPIKPTDLDKVREMIEQRKEYQETVRHPGKFEGCQAYVPFYWDTYLNGYADDDNGTTLTFDVSENDRLMFPELEGREQVYLMERSDGFVVELSKPTELEEEKTEEENS